MKALRGDDGRGMLELTYPVNGQKVTVAEASHLGCSVCGEVMPVAEEVRGCSSDSGDPLDLLFACGCPFLRRPAVGHWP